MAYIFLFLAGTFAFLVSTLSGGGGSLMLLPFLNFFFGPVQTPPILNLGAFIGRPARVIIFWKHIQWKVVLYYAPMAILGAWIGSWLFDKIDLKELQILVGIFLISTLFQFRFGKKKQSFPMKIWYFIPLGFLFSILGTMIGALGPVLNPFYLNAGISKEKLIATKAVNSFFLGISQIGSYIFFGLITQQLFLYGLALGMGAVVGNIIAKRFLTRMKDETFRKILIAFMVFSGVLLIVKQLNVYFDLF